jgi:hypothetical protein
MFDNGAACGQLSWSSRGWVVDSNVWQWHIFGSECSQHHSDRHCWKFCVFLADHEWVRASKHFRACERQAVFGRFYGSDIILSNQHRMWIVLFRRGAESDRWVRHVVASQRNWKRHVPFERKYGAFCCCCVFCCCCCFFFCSYPFVLVHHFSCICDEPISLECVRPRMRVKHCFAGCEFGSKLLL